jgi:hypothetical protein
MSQTVFSRISELIDEIGGTTKQASIKKAAPETVLGHTGSGKKDPGGYQGPSTHPSAMVCSNSEAAPIGARFKENHSDMTDPKNPANVDKTPAGMDGMDADKQMQIGTDKSLTGEDPKVEDDFQAKPKDPGTSSIMDADTVGGKYASFSLEELTKKAFDQFEEILADIANNNEINSPKQASQTHQEVKVAAQAGYELAAAAANAPSVQEKKAVASDIIAHFIKTAEEDADLVGSYLSSYQQRKYAVDPTAGAPPMDGGALPPEMMGGGGEGGAPPMGGGPPPMGGAPMGPPPGGDPSGGGAPPMDAGGAGGGGHEEAINELANALLELGIPPEALIQAMQGQGGAGGGAPPMGGEGGGAPPAPEGVGAGEKGAAARIHPEDRQLLIKYAKEVQQLKRVGRMQIKEATPGEKRQARDEVKNYILEMCGR